MLSNISAKVKIALLLGAIIIIASIAYGVYTYNDRMGKIAVTVSSTPSDAHITFNGTSEGNGTVYLKEGSYDVKATKEGFADASFKQYIDSSHTIVTIPLTAQSDSAKQWAKDHQNLYTELEGKAGQAANQQGETFRDKNPIVNLLPYSNFLFTIGYSNDPSDPSGNSIIIQIDAREGYRQGAINQIKSWGYDPTEYKIKFNNYENPFKS